MFNLFKKRKLFKNEPSKQFYELLLTNCDENGAGYFRVCRNDNGSIEDFKLISNSNDVEDTDFVLSRDEEGNLNLKHVKYFNDNTQSTEQ